MDFKSAPNRTKSVTQLHHHQSSRSDSIVFIVCVQSSVAVALSFVEEAALISICIALDRGGRQHLHSSKFWGCFLARTSVDKMALKMVATELVGALRMRCQPGAASSLLFSLRPFSTGAWDPQFYYLRIVSPERFMEVHCLIVLLVLRDCMKTSKVTCTHIDLEVPCFAFQQSGRKLVCLM